MRMNEHIQTYLDQLKQKYARNVGHGRKHFSLLAELLHRFDSELTLINDDASAVCGAPNYILLKGNELIGYVEVQNTGTDLEKAIQSDRCKQHRDHLLNYILTNQLEFCWYSNGELQHRVILGRAVSFQYGYRIEDALGDEGDLARLFVDFVNQQAKTRAVTHHSTETGTKPVSQTISAPVRAEAGDLHGKENHMTQEKVKEIIDMLNTLNEYLLALPDDMLLNIDPRDNESVQQGLEFIQKFNDNMAVFSQTADKIDRQLQTFFEIEIEEDEVEGESMDEGRRVRIIRDLDKTEPHSLDESFTYKRPYGFVLGKAAYKGLQTWRNLYLQTLSELRSLDPERFARLPQESKFISKRGKPWFGPHESDFRQAERLSPGFYLEVNLSANNIRDNLKLLLSHFGLNYREMKIYLREDRDA